MTATSANWCGIGACGLCTVTVAATTRGSSRQAAASRSASVSIRLTGGPVDDLDQPVGQLAVVHGVGHVVGGGGRREIELEHDVDDEVLAGFALEVVDAVVAASRQAGRA